MAICVTCVKLPRYTCREYQVEIGRSFRRVYGLLPHQQNVGVVVGGAGGGGLRGGLVLKSSNGVPGYS